MSRGSLDDYPLAHAARADMQREIVSLTEPARISWHRRALALTRQASPSVAFCRPWLRTNSAPLPLRDDNSVRFVARHGHPKAGARMRPVVPHRAVLDTAVVPERDRVRAASGSGTGRAGFPRGPRDTPKSRRFRRRHPGQPPREAAVDVQRFLAVTDGSESPGVRPADSPRFPEPALVEPAIAPRRRGSLRAVQIGLHAVGKRLKAAYMLANRVSPPFGGVFLI